MLSGKKTKERVFTVYQNICRLHTHRHTHME